MILVFWLLFADPARADAIDAPPDACPAGSRATSSHAGAWCEAETCPASCPDGQRCAPIALCVVNEALPCGGGGSGEDCTVAARRVTGTCEDGAACAQGTCEIADRCVPAPTPAALPAAGCFGCQHGTAPGLAAITGLLILGALAFRGRSR